MKRGISAAVIIIIVAIVLLLGFAGYTGYRYYTDDGFDVYGLVQMADLQEVEGDKGDIIDADVEEAAAGNEEAEASDGDMADNEMEDMDLAGFLEGMTSTPEDASRQADLNNVIAAVEIFANDNGFYPQGTRCVSDMEELKIHFKDGVLPADETGGKVFSTEDGSLLIDCPGGYLYQDFGDGEYLVWALMDDEKNGNMENLVTDKADAVKGEEGKYSMHGSISAGAGSMVPYVAPENAGGDVQVEEKVTKGVPRISG